MTPELQEEIAKVLWEADPDVISWEKLLVESAPGKSIVAGWLSDDLYGARRAALALAPIIARLVAEERERCAQVCDAEEQQDATALATYRAAGHHDVADRLACCIDTARSIKGKIRARGESRE